MRSILNPFFLEYALCAARPFCPSLKQRVTATTPILDEHYRLAVAKKRVPGHQR